MGPSYGSMGAAAQGEATATGVTETGRSTPAASSAPQDPQRRGYLDQSGRVALQPQERQADIGAAPALGATTGLEATTGLGTATYAVRGGARIDSSPQGPLRSAVPSQLQQTPSPQLHQSTPLSTHTATPQQHSHPLQGSEATGQISSPSPVPSPSGYPDPQHVPQPAQAMRSWTTQVASAAAAMSQRIHLQSVLGQGHVELHAGEVFGPGVEGLNFNVEGSRMAFPPVHDPPSLPPHLRHEEGHDSISRHGVLAGLTRAAQALRRRVFDPFMQHVTRTTQPPNSYAAGDVAHGGVPAPSAGGAFPPAVAEAMQEWTARPSLLTPGTSGTSPASRCKLH